MITDGIWVFECGRRLDSMDAWLPSDALQTAAYLRLIAQCRLQRGYKLGLFREMLAPLLLQLVQPRGDL